MLELLLVMNLLPNYKKGREQETGRRRKAITKVWRERERKLKEQQGKQERKDLKNSKAQKNNNHYNQINQSHTNYIIQIKHTKTCQIF